MENNGYISHPNWSFPNGYGVYFTPCPNKTAKTFKTKAAAVNYLKKNKIKIYRYKNYQGVVKNYKIK